MKYKNIFFRRKILIMLILILSLSLAGVSYGYWSTEINIGTDITTASLNLDFADNANQVVNISVTSGSAIDCVNVDFKIKNNGSVAAKLKEETITINGEVFTRNLNDDNNQVGNDICDISYASPNGNLCLIGNEIEGLLSINLEILNRNIQNNQADNSIEIVKHESTSLDYAIDVELLFNQFCPSNLYLDDAFDGGWSKTLNFTVYIHEEKEVEASVQLPTQKVQSNLETSGEPLPLMEVINLEDATFQENGIEIQNPIK